MEWFYEHDGKAVGPVSRADIIRLIIQRHIQWQTLVWTPEFGDEWRPAGKAGLIVPRSLRSGKQPFFAIRIERLAANPPPMASCNLKSRLTVSSLWAWMLILLPSGLDMFYAIVGYSRGQYCGENVSTLANLFISVIFFFSFCLDRRELLRAGILPPSFWWWLLLPVYFWKRCLKLGRGRGLFLCSIFIFMLEAVVCLYNPPPITVGDHEQNIGWGHMAVPIQGDKVFVPDESSEASPPSSEEFYEGADI